MSEEYTKWAIPDVSGPERETTQSALHIHRQQTPSAPSEQVHETPQPLTAEDIESIRQAAFDEGYQEGLTLGQREGQAQGHAEGYAKGEQEGLLTGIKNGEKEGFANVKAKAELFESLATKLFDPLQQIDDNVEQQLLLLCVELAKAVIAVEVKTQPEIVLQALQQGMTVLPIKDEVVTIKCHPDDISIVHEQFSEAELNKRQWQVVADDAISQGGCELLTQHNAVDMTMHRRFRQVIEKFMTEQGLPHESLTR
jgi:flagellar assembly protein FliH